jgi:hypothetical protein
MEGLPGQRGMQGCWRFAWRGIEGPSWSPVPAHSYLQALQRKTNDSLGTVNVVIVILNRSSSPCLFREAVVGKSGAGDPSHITSMDTCAKFSFSCLCCNLLFPKKEISKLVFHQNAVSP